MSNEKCGISTPHGTLLEQLLNSNIAKSEREWAAAKEIRRLADALQENAEDIDQLSRIINKQVSEFAAWKGELQTSESAAVPTPQEAAPGWQLVPIVPTPGMIIAGRSAPCCTAAESDIIEDYIAIYQAMLEAAPKPPAPASAKTLPLTES